jgi:hypothetical protein
VPVIDGNESWEDGPNELYETIEEAKEAMQGYIADTAEEEEDDANAEA